jgi:integrase
MPTMYSNVRERGYIADNPASGIKAIRRQKGLPEANRPWSDQERDAALDGAPDHVRPAIALMMFTGLGPKDALALPRNFVKAGEIATRRSKTGAPVFWDMPAPLAAILTSAPPHAATTLCANSRGWPWTLDGFRASWRTLRIRLEKAGAIGSGLTLYGLRHTVAVILRESGADERTIADALGQKTIEMARHYAQGCGSSRQDARSCEKLRCGIGQTANKNCQTGLKKVSNFYTSRKCEIKTTSKNNWVRGRRGGTRTPNPRFWRPVL